MSPYILIIGMLAIPAIVFFILRVNAALVFLSLCLGSVLVRFIGPDAKTLFGYFSPSRSLDSSTTLIILLALPAVLTTIFMIGSIKGTGRALVNIIPSLAFGVIALLLVYPLLPMSLRTTLDTSPVWHNLTQAQDLAVGVSSIIGLFFLWLSRPGRGGGEAKHHKH